MKDVCQDGNCGNFDMGFENHCRALKYIPDYQCFARMSRTKADAVDKQDHNYVLDLKMARTRCKRELRGLDHYQGSGFGRQELKIMTALIDDELIRIGAE